MTDGQNDENDEPRLVEPRSARPEAIVVSERFKGPTPHPAVLHQYEQVLPGSADRVFTMAEKALDHQIAMERDESRRATLGLKLAALIALAVLASAVVLVTLGQTSWGVGVIVGETGVLTALFLGGKLSARNRGDDVQEREPKRVT